jgi:3-hydroxyacyl-CoA dehydrogenase
MRADVALCGLGAGGAGVLRACRNAGLSVCVVEEDPATLNRVCEMLARQTAATFAQTTEMGDVKAPVVVSVSDPDGELHPAELLILWSDPQVLQSSRRPGFSVAMDLSDPDFVEVAFGQADAQTRLRANDFLSRIGAEALVSVRPDQFAGTFLLDRALAMGDRLMLAGVAPWELDDALKEAGFSEGLLAAQDRIGLDVAFARRRRAGQALLVSDRMVQEGRLGQSVGVGWYRYPGGGGAVVDPLMEDMIVEEARFAGLERVDMTERAAAEALMLGLLNAAAILIGQGMTTVELNLICARKLGLPDLTAAARRWPGEALFKALEDLAPLDPALWAPDAGLHLLTA